MHLYVSICGFVTQPGASHLGTNQDAKVYDPNTALSFELAEVKCPDICNISEAGHDKSVNGQTKL